VKGSRRRERERADAWALWLDAMRIAEQTGGLEFCADPALARRVSDTCRGALVDVFEAVWAGKPAAGAPAVREALAALGEWAHFRRHWWESERQQAPSAAAHVLVAPSLAELTAASVRDGAADLDEMDALAEVPSQHTLLRLAGRFAGNGSCKLTVDELLELDDTDLRHALEGIALHRGLWPVMSDLRWLQAARALRAGGGPNGGR
jgi:hypothetical protein